MEFLRAMLTLETMQCNFLCYNNDCNDGNYERKYDK